MKTKREEKLEVQLSKLQKENQNIRKELHTCKQKNRDMEKSRESYKSNVVWDFAAPSKSLHFSTIASIWVLRIFPASTA